MQKIYYKYTNARQLFLSDLDKCSKIDYEKSFFAPDLCFVTKDGKEYWAPSFNVYIQQLVEFAEAPLIPEGCFSYAQHNIILFKDGVSFDDKEDDVEESTEEENQETGSSESESVESEK